MPKHDGALLAVMFILLSVAMIFFVVAVVHQEFLKTATETLETMTQESISRGYALFCPNTGELAWVGECDKEQ